ncbi:MAG: hypothetical protein ABI855_02235, partial [Bacteroidota bacterium]
MTVFSKLIQIPLREVWQHESSDFSNWLALQNNLKLLGDEVGLKLELIKREAIAGKYRVDLLAKEVEKNSIVIIENQLEETDHSHLGKLITYSSHYDAKFIIWIVKDLRIEHEKSVEWLNLNLADEVKIFLVRIEVFKIENSPPAPKFSIISKPYGWTNKLFRKELEMEELPLSAIKYEELLKALPRKSIIDFLDKFIVIDTRYTKKEILFEYQKQFPEDCDYYFKTIRDFKKALK